MAELCGISPDTITWTTRWYLREDTLRAANAAIINSRHRHPLARVWGGGTLSSSDGLRFPIRGRSLTARAQSRYFVDQGGTAYTHVSDQHTTYGTQMIITTDRDATYVLDEILGNTTDLPIAEHTTDTHGQTLLTFALFDLVGLRLSPRIAKLTQQRLWRPHPPSHYHRWPQAGSLLAHPVQTQLIDQHWDDLLRIGRSAKVATYPPPSSSLVSKPDPANILSPKRSSNTENSNAPTTRCGGSPTKPSAAASAVNSTAANPSTDYAASCSSPTAAKSATNTAKIKPPKSTAIHSSPTHVFSGQPSISGTPSRPTRTKATPSRMNT